VYCSSCCVNRVKQCRTNVKLITNDNLFTRLPYLSSNGKSLARKRERAEQNLSMKWSTPGNTIRAKWNPRTSRNTERSNRDKQSGNHPITILKSWEFSFHAMIAASRISLSLITRDDGTIWRQRRGFWWDQINPIVHPLDDSREMTKYANATYERSFLTINALQLHRAIYFSSRSNSLTLLA
jgi:hypothetical protein